jgi:alkylation response protein AidB-like acyl-CoA dehydrogenase
MEVIWLQCVLTEPGAGSSLSDIATDASSQQDGTYRIKGQKIFISAGDHDITENIVHLVLARTKDAPKGVERHFTFCSAKENSKPVMTGWITMLRLSVSIIN